VDMGEKECRAQSRLMNGVGRKVGRRWKEEGGRKKVDERRDGRGQERRNFFLRVWETDTYIPANKL